ncbi:Xdj1p KNAG_0G02050 [Huiozyma naganishii CBS 8797]|uniref:J domain-containing protein n=1 Tax=Huiozyma naganishii (strain ATCC MYA-139 / BCRC 22969 / CBS 8797 / KCTC 17520 / NBRC 10181 / NCYC 3082 / Yp74L-3) TaxID=1071383 RepID=J7S117_HUIN7|nr:hypothetical protein KNAG_0G02050 [Kazachstania naganishii CBS 8797]CCK71262.1 hypothetical protein KNAG_0G02050 [Kazachstania naganishii CBS 8797]
MAKLNPYDILGVDRDSTDDEIRKAYRKLALKFHPDKVIDPEEKASNEMKFKEITTAYEILSNGEYVEEMEEEYEGQGYGFNFGDDFMNFFNEGRNAHPMGGHPQREDESTNEATQIEIEVTLKDLYNGKNVKFQLTRNVICTLCDGNCWRRRKNGDLYSPPVLSCTKCKGAGYVERLVGDSPFFQYVQRISCRKCFGKGEYTAKPTSDKNKCKLCHGEGLIKEKQQLLVTIPRGSENSNTIIFKEKGDEDLRTRRAGDIVFRLKLHDEPNGGDPDILVTKEGTDLHMNIEIPLIEAISGTQGRFLTKTFDDRVLKLTMPQGKVLRPGDTIVIKGEGWPKTPNGTEFGDMFVHVNVEFPPDNWISERNDITTLTNVLPAGKSDDGHAQTGDANNAEFVKDYEILKATDEGTRSSNTKTASRPPAQGLYKCSIQ